MRRMLRLSGHGFPNP